MKTTLFLAVCLLILSSCKDDDDTNTNGTNPPNVLGMDYAISNSTFDDTYDTLANALNANENITIIAEVNHTSNAESVDETLAPTRLILFGNPNLGTPLMQQNQLAGLDLPQKMLVYQNADNEVYVGFNNTTYLANRYALSGIPTLPTIQGALENLARGASQDSIIAATDSGVTLEEGIITKTKANKSFDAVYASLKMAIESNENLKIIAELDHQANAAGIGQDLNPTRIIVFGNPNLGTPLMQNAQTTAIDLPQKILVWENAENNVYVSYNEPSFLAKRHGITENSDVLETISTALDNLSNAALAD